MSFIDIISAFTNLTLFILVPYVASVEFDVIRYTPVSIKNVSFIACDTDSIWSAIHTISTHIHAIWSTFYESFKASCAGSLRFCTVYRSYAFSIVYNCPKSTFGTDSIVSGVGCQTRRTIFKTVTVGIKRVSWLANKTLISGSIERTLGNGCWINAFSCNTKFEALATSKTDIAWGITVIAVVGAGKCDGDE